MMSDVSQVLVLDYFSPIVTTGQVVLQPTSRVCHGPSETETFGQLSSTSMSLWAKTILGVNTGHQMKMEVN